MAAVLLVILGFFFLGLVLLVARYQRIPVPPGRVDTEWALNVSVGLLPGLMFVCLAITVARLPRAVRGDVVHRPTASRLTAALRAWWLGTVVVDTVTLLALVVGYAAGGAGRYHAPIDSFQFTLPVAALIAASVTYSFARGVLSRLPTQLMRLWHAGRLR